ncbi:MAG: enolase C-terminal domain-like protein [Patescibacteria group bacterium]
MAILNRLVARTILDSRGEWTIEVLGISSSGNSAKASIPTGKSIGEREAVSLPAERALESIKEIFSKFSGYELWDLEKIDRDLLSLDGTKNKSRLGANAILGTSLVCHKLQALEEEIPLWKKIELLLRVDVSHRSLPLLFGNLINGGLHAEGSNLPFQEYLVIPQVSSFRESAQILVTIFHALHIKNPGRFSLVGDEGGFSGFFEDPLEPFRILKDTSNRLGFSEKIRFGIDAAGNTLPLSPQEALGFYRKMKNDFDLLYLEDPFPEMDENSFIRLQEEFKGIFIAGDDLTTTNASSIREMADKGAISSAIIKPNQIGTMTETLEALRECYRKGIEPVLSHRSGETNDDFVADIAYGARAYGIKLGAPSRGERVAKYDRLLEIEETRS